MIDRQTELPVLSPEESGEYTMNYTRIQKAGLSKPGFKAASKESPHGEFMGISLTGRDFFKTDGCIDHGFEGEVDILIDEKTQPELRGAYETLLQRAGERLSLRYFDEEMLLKDAIEHAMDIIPYREKSSRKMDKQHKGKVVSLVEYFGKNKGGVCRQQADLAGYFTSKLIADGYLKGTMSIDRGQKRGKEVKGHQWGRFTNEEGKVYILDTAHWLAVKDIHWDYRRPEDKQLGRELIVVKPHENLRVVNRRQSSIAPTLPKTSR